MSDRNSRMSSSYHRPVGPPGKVSNDDSEFGWVWGSFGLLFVVIVLLTPLWIVISKNEYEKRTGLKRDVFRQPLDEPGR